MNLLINCNSLNIPLADGSVNCVVTSPPYYGLRDYGTAKWEGGDPNCEHKLYLGGHSQETSPKQLSSKGTQRYNYRDVCRECGAIRVDQQIGLEQTPDEYVADLVQVFREVWRVLRDDGTVWLNLGDSYSGSGNGSNDYRESGASISKNDNKYGSHKPGPIRGLKSKDLIGIPWMVAFALRVDGWYLRQDIIWAKPNPMPESVRDRCTKAHEYVFLLSKSPHYYYDYEAVKEKSTQNGKPHPTGQKISPDRNDQDAAGKTLGDGVSRNRRSVWTIPTRPYKGAHYATFPPDLVKPMILAGCPAGGTVLDPFAGSGTTILVANQLGRNGIGLDLNFQYLRENAKERLRSVQPTLI